MKIKNTSTKNILFIVSSLGFGGAERVVSELANYYSNIGNEIHIMLISNNKINYRISEKIQIIDLNSKIVNKTGFFAIYERLRLIRKYTNQLNPDIVISFLAVINIYVCFSLMLSKHKLIISERNDPKNDPKGCIKRLTRLLAYELADGFVFQTNIAKQYFSKRIQYKSIVIANPIKANLPEPIKGIKSKKIIAIGRLVNQKNYPLLIYAFNEIQKEFNEYTLFIYGEGEDKNKIEELICTLCLENKIILKGNVSNVHEEVSDASLYVLTSNYEGMPNALMESMSMGIPCISVDCSGGGPALLINNGENGILVRTNSKDDLADAMRELLTDIDLSKKLSSNALRDSKKYSIQNIANQWMDYINSVLEGKNYQNGKYKYKKCIR